MSVVAGTLESTVRLATPLLLAAMGEVVAERSGVLNLGVEGMMLAGALGGFAAAVVTGSVWIGFLAGMLAGTALAALHAFLCITLKADQVISGIMLTLLGTGLTTYFGRGYIGINIDGFATIPIPGLSAIPVVGEAFFSVTALDYLSLVLVPVIWYFLFRTNVGAEITAVGEDPETADTAGIPVFRLQYACVLLGGALAGAAGAQLSLAFTNFWGVEMVAGRGWIAVALVIFAQWGIWRLLGGAYLFAAIDALSFRSGAVREAILGVADVSALESALGFFLNPQVMETYPYLMTVLVLWAVMRRGNLNEMGAPGALLDAYSREQD
jgi:simple sugar transport system permease protein